NHSTDLFVFTAPPPPAIHTLSLHDALPICPTSSRWSKKPWLAPLREVERTCRDSSLSGPTIRRTECQIAMPPPAITTTADNQIRSEEHTSELQSRGHLVCRLLLEKKKKTNK